ncbi:MAG TPA: radical SAM/SPASM domain-containing protein [Actinocrinis sp.]|jgi:MoaA/NifB/PqqE/SkfB family radical SAM enzyme|uniref:radical SAM/SPASM domain-containing protein n=1 Tax=Actinocrinis sp. TaxID=1920516 RepID=UPI002DDD09B7|nr:radical SAM/SPASM domain-containing protein [Actinocrinis sp.]HEV3172193.1 radical SAM/SPASM domain-containing protein [Actinocrinis sp.]
MTAAAQEATTFLWLEITGRCQLECVHCYAESSPAGDHGAMAAEDWERVLAQAAAHGVEQVQLIGGEPTLHPDFARLVGRALELGLEVEVYTNLYRVPAALWEVFSRPGVRIATSWYSADPHAHEAITGRVGSHARTRANIAEAVRRGIPIRAGIIELGDEQGTEHARTELIALGLAENAIGFDRLRAFGRGAAALPDETDTCGECGHGCAAVLPDGSVVPCVFTRMAVAGSVRSGPLDAILAGSAFGARVEHLDRVRTVRDRGCGPTCMPCTPCPPCRPSCSPMG